MGLASNEQGAVVSLLQCKWQWNGGASLAASGVWSERRGPMRLYLAHMVAQAPSPKWADEVINLDEIVRLMLKHSVYVPLARTLRVGTPAIAAA